MAMVETESLGLRLLLARTRLRWSIGRLEAESGVPASAISRYERDKTVPPSDRLLRLARALKTSPNDLLLFDAEGGFSDSPKPGELSSQAAQAA